MADPTVAQVEGTKRFPCRQCGAQLRFQPGADFLLCDYCGFKNELPQSAEDIEELDFTQYLEIAREESEPDHEQTVKCNACAAQFSVSGITTADKCPFCGSNTVVPVPSTVRIQPKSLLPFKVDQKEALSIYGKWISSRFWAPNALKEYARRDHGLKGMYLPYWTFDSKTTSWYSGMRGDYYYETETYTEYVNGEPQTRTRQVRRTHWTPVSGTVWRDFDDVMAPGSQTLPENHVLSVQTWDLAALKPYQDEYLSGFHAERYSIGLEQGFGFAKGVMDNVILGDVRSDIGGDEQQVSSVDTQYDAITFKHILVPLWLGAYQFKGKSYRFMINGRTGAISGDAPVSGWKVFFAVLLFLIVAGTIFVLVNKGQ